MLHIDVVAVGRLKNGPFHFLWNDYAGRLNDWQLKLVEIDDRKPTEASIIARLTEADYVFVLDERGKSLHSRAFADRLGKLETDGRTHIAFVIGGADGHSDSVRARADFLLSFGVQTWPHMLARVMLSEQIYRARQILSGHPYHRA